MVPSLLQLTCSHCSALCVAFLLSLETATMFVFFLALLGDEGCSYVVNGNTFLLYMLENVSLLKI